MARSRLAQGTPIDPIESHQEPYVHIIAPNLDQISRDGFRGGTVARRRAIRGLVVLGIAIVLMLMVGVVGALVASAQAR